MIGKGGIESWLLVAAIPAESTQCHTIAYRCLLPLHPLLLFFLWQTRPDSRLFWRWLPLLFFFSQHLPFLGLCVPYVQNLTQQTACMRPRTRRRAGRQPMTSGDHSMRNMCSIPASPVLPALLAAFGRASRPDAASDEVRTLVIVLLQERCGVSARHTLVDSPAPGPTLPHSDFDILLDTVALTLSRMLVDADASVSLNLGATPP